jgi:aspartate racemase
MGPEATVLLQRKLIDATPANDDNDHIPLLIDMNPQVPSRIAHLVEGTGEDPGPTLAAMARRLQEAGAVALAMPCNTAHHYAKAITGAVEIPLLDMVEIAADHALGTVGKGGCVGALASPAVQRTGLFDKALARRGLTVAWPANEAPLLAAIRDIKRNTPLQRARAALNEASADLAARGAVFQLVGCSEFSLIADSVAPGVTGVDTLDLLTDAIVAFHRLSGT